MWFEYHFNDNVDLIFKVWDMKKLYKFYEENVYKKSRETKDLTDGLYYVLKKIVEDNFEEKKYIKAISLEYDNLELNKKDPCPCLFFEIDYENLPKEKTLKIYKNIIDFLVLHTVKFSTAEINGLMKKIIYLEKEGFHLWNIGFMVPRNKFLRLVWGPCTFEKCCLLSQNMGYEICSNNRYSNYLDNNAEYILDCDFTGDFFTNLGTNIYHKSYEKRVDMLKKISHYENISMSTIYALLKWPQKKIYCKKDKKGLLIWQICHMKLRADGSPLKVYIRLEDFGL